MEYNWKEYKEQSLDKLKTLIEESGVEPTLAIIQVGSLPESNTYVRNKIKACERIGIKPFLYSFSENVTEEFLITIINQLNEDKTINGLFIQLPIPGIKDATRIVEAINPIKDVDGLTEKNFASLAYGKHSITPCTPKGIMEMLKHMNTPLDGKDVVIIGRSHLVGLPLMHLLLQENATVTICHSHTENLKEKTKNADVIITAVGNHKNLITADMVKEGAVVIDVAISKDNETGKLYGDADYESLKEKCSYITPVPGGVGQLTVLELMKNVVEASLYQKKLKDNKPSLIIK